jgi:hypothetical protein
MWEALSGGVHRAARHSVYLGVFVACLAAAHASASPAPMLFKLSIVATAHAEWDHTRAPVPDGGCTRTVRAEGIRDAHFRTTRPAIARAAGGRLLATMLRGLAGTVTLAGANTVTDVCGAERQEAIQDCATTTRSFARGTIALVGDRPGSLTLRPVRNVRLRARNCPLEPVQVVRAPVGLIHGPLKLSTATLANKRFTHITLTANASRKTRYGPVEQGMLTERSRWKITLERIQP